VAPNRISVADGGTELLPLVTREGWLVAEAMARAQSLFPWLVRGVGFDNDSAFMNDIVVPIYTLQVMLHRWCLSERLQTPDLAEHHLTPLLCIC
jgi:hypothetical protein